MITVQEMAIVQGPGSFNIVRIAIPDDVHWQAQHYGTGVTEIILYRTSISDLDVAEKAEVDYAAML